MPDIKETQVEVIINKHSNLLIIGKGATNYSIKKVSYETNHEEVLKKYGESDISEAFKVAKDFGVEYIFILNLRNSYDYFDISETIQQGDFTYITPVSVYLSDTFNDAYKNDKKVSYIAHILSLTGVNNESVIIATDRHASLFEDVDAFLAAQQEAEDIFLRSCEGNLNMENIIAVTNNLADCRFGNVALASALCVSDIPEYPAGFKGKAIFDIDSFDITGNYAFFKNHTSKETSVENLINFRDKGSEKIVSVSRILKMIKRELDFSEFNGRLYTEYQRIRIEKKLHLYLSSLSGYVIYKYLINGVQARKNANYPTTVTVSSFFDVWPVNCLEKCHLERSIEI